MLGERYLERLLTAEPVQVHEAARRYLTPDRAGLVVYRPRLAAPFASSGEEARTLLRQAPAYPLPATPPRVAAPGARTAPPTLERREAGVHVHRTTDGPPIL